MSVSFPGGVWAETFQQENVRYFNKVLLPSVYSISNSCASAKTALYDRGICGKVKKSR